MEQPNFSIIAPELLNNITRYLTVHDIVVLQLVCKHFYRTIEYELNVTKQLVNFINNNI